MRADLGTFAALIKARCGLHLGGNAGQTLAAALEERERALGLGPGDYLRKLQADDAEFQELVNRVTINETYFFREAEQMDFFVRRMAPRLLAAGRNAEPVRVLCAGCSTGEEPYSLAMALAEAYDQGAATLFSLTGVDIDTRALAKARAARYSEFSFRNMPEALRDKYFDRRGRLHELKPGLRERVAFRGLNLLAESFPAELGGFDVIFFRNVSLYFDKPTRKAVQLKLASLLREDGALLLGATETLANDLGVLRLREECGLFYFVQGRFPEAGSRAGAFCPLGGETAKTASRAAPATDAAHLAARGAGGPKAAGKRAGSSGETPPLPAAPDAAALCAARELAEDHRCDEALPLLETFLAAHPGDGEARMLKAFALLDRKAFAAAEELAHGVLREDPWSVDALMVLGLAAKWGRTPEEAVVWFKQAVYANPACWPAHFHLAGLLQKIGETESARRAYRAVVRLLGAGVADTGVKHLPLGLSPGEVGFLCGHRLADAPHDPRAG